MNLGHWNCRSFGPFARPEAVKFAREHDLAVIALCETRERFKRNEELSPDFWYYSSRARNGVGGCGFIVRKGLETQFSPISARCGQMITTLKGVKIGLMSIYAPTDISSRRVKSEFFKEVEYCYMSLTHICDHVLIADDWNCELGKDVEFTSEVRHSFSTENMSSDNGMRLVKLATRLRVRILNTYFPGKLVTRHSWSHPRSNLSSLKDMFLGDREFQEFVIVIKTLKSTSSDHRLVLMKVTEGLFNVRKRSRQSLRRGRRAVQKRQPERTVKRSSRPDFGGSKEERDELKSRCAAWWAEHGEGNPATLLNSLIRCQTEVFSTSAAINPAIPPSGRGENFAKWVTASLKNIHKRPKAAISEEVFARHCDVLFNRPSVSEELPVIRKRRDPVESLGALPTLEEVNEVIGNLRLGTAPGESGLCPEILVYGGWRIRRAIHEYFVSLWPKCRGGGGAPLPLEFRGARVIPIFKAGDKCDPSNYRTIFLLEVVGKLLFRLLNSRLEFLTEDSLWDSQNGFRKRRGTGHSALALTLLQERCIDVGAPLCAAFLDVSKAFDSLPRRLIMQVLSAIGVPEDLVYFYREVHTDVWCTIGTGSNRFLMGRGVRQGSPEGPSIFNIVYQHVLEEALSRVPELGIRLIGQGQFDKARVSGGAAITWIRLMMFADDCCLVSTDANALTRAINAVNEVGSDLGIRINPKKSQIVWLSGRGERPMPVTMGKETIPEVNETKYLGVWVGSEARATKTLGNAKVSIARAIEALNAVRPLLRRQDLTVGQRASVVCTYVLPSLWYGCESARLSKLMIREYERFLWRLKVLVWNWRPGRSRRRPREPPLMPRTAHKVLAIRRVCFLVNLVVNPSCVTTRDILLSKVEGRTRGGYSSAHFGRSIAADLAYITGQWEQPMLSLQLFIEVAREEKARITAEVELKAKSPPLTELWEAKRRQLVHAKLSRKVKTTLGDLWALGTEYRASKSSVKRPQTLQCRNVNCLRKFACEKERARHYRGDHQPSGRQPGTGEVKCPFKDCYRVFSVANNRLSRHLTFHKQ